MSGPENGDRSGSMSHQLKQLRAITISRVPIARYRNLHVALNIEQQFRVGNTCISDRHTARSALFKNRVSRNKDDWYFRILPP